MKKHTIIMVAVVLVVGYFMGVTFPQFGASAAAKLKGATGL